MNGHPAAGICLVASTVPWVAQRPVLVSTSVAMVAPSFIDGSVPLSG